MFDDLINALQPTDEVLTAIPFILWVYITLISPKPFFMILAAVSTGFLSNLNQIDKMKDEKLKVRYKNSINNSSLGSFLLFAGIVGYAVSFIWGLYSINQILANEQTIYPALKDLASLQFIGFAFYWVGFLLISSFFSILVLNLISDK